MTPKEVEDHTILRVVVGSTAHGLNLDNNGDRDELGVCIEPLEAFGGFNEFEQYVYRSAAEREGKKDAPSQPGDLDLTIYSLKKFLRLALHGNPTILDVLFIKNRVVAMATGMQLQEIYPHIISRQCGKRFLGYMQAQKQRLLGERGGKDVNRPELVEKYGYDTKYAMHVLRLGMQGFELMSTGKLDIPMRPDDREFLRDVRNGRYPLEEVVRRAEALEALIKVGMDDSFLPDQPNYDFVQEWMLNRYWDRWKAQRFKYDHYPQIKSGD